MEDRELIYTDIGKFVKVLRLRAGFSQKHVASLVGCGRHLISRIERGTYKPNIKILERLYILLLRHQPEYVDKDGWIKTRDFK